MIVNTELENKGNIFPSKIIDFKKDVDTLYFTTDNDVILGLTVVREMLRMVYLLTKTKVVFTGKRVMSMVATSLR